MREEDMDFNPHYEFAKGGNVRNMDEAYVRMNKGYVATIRKYEDLVNHPNIDDSPELIEIVNMNEESSDKFKNQVTDFVSDIIVKTPPKYVDIFLNHGIRDVDVYCSHPNGVFGTYQMPNGREFDIFIPYISKGSRELNVEKYKAKSAFTKSMKKYIEENCTKMSKGGKITIKDIEKSWDKNYGEDFKKEYSGLYKELKKEKDLTPRKLDKLWDQNYGEDFKYEYYSIYEDLGGTYTEEEQEILDEDYKYAKGGKVKELIRCCAERKGQAESWLEKFNRDTLGGKKLYSDLEIRKVSKGKNKLGFEQFEYDIYGYRNFAKGGKIPVFVVSGYYKDDNSEFSNYLISEFDEVPKGFDDDDIFYYGMSEKELKNSSENDGNDFVITEYKRLKSYAKGGKTKIKNMSKYKKGGWIQEATKEMEEDGTEGAFTKQAKRAGMSTTAFAKKVLKNPKKFNETTRKRALFMKNTNPEKFNVGGEIVRAYDVNVNSGVGTYARGGKSQGYNAQLDESLGMRKGAKRTKQQSDKDRRDEAKAMNKAMGRRAYASVRGMDKGRRMMAKGSQISWSYKEFKGDDALEKANKFIANNRNKYQTQLIFINDGFGVEYRPLRKMAKGGGVKKPRLKRGDKIYIDANKWQDSYGNTYHIVQVYVNDDYLGESDYTYGYGNQYEDTAREMIFEKYNPPYGYKDAMRTPIYYLKDKGIQVRSRGQYVDRKRDIRRFDVGGQTTMAGDTDYPSELLNYAKGGWHKDRKYISDEKHEKAYAPKRKTAGKKYKKAQGGNIMQDISPNANTGDGDVMPDASSMVDYAKGGWHRDRKFASKEEHEKDYAPKRKKPFKRYKGRK